MLLLLTIVIQGCAKDHYHDRATDDPRYHEGQGIPVTDSVGVGGKTKAYNITPTSGGAGAAAIGLIESGIALAAYPDYYKPSTISGVCLIGQERISQTPCRNIGLDLVDAAGKVVGSTTTDGNGHYAFYVKKDKNYTLKVTGDRYKPAREISKFLKMGARVELVLVRFNGD
ncbi:MAG TPA: hypothetical protein PKC28_04665 [Bdellovibrionales bacterium]|nr:hypothetical protein [Bdellovibrionales bacterium]